MRKEIWDDLEVATFRDIPWHVQSVTTGGGRKATAKPILNSSEQVVDDVGLSQRTYSVSGYLAASYYKTSPTTRKAAAILEKLGIEVETIKKEYRDQREELAAAFEAPGDGTFIHPFEGEIEHLVVTSYSIDESMTDVGIGRVNVEFVVRTARPIPEPIEGEKEATRGVIEESLASILADLLEEYATGENLPSALAVGGKLGAAFEAAQKVVEGVKTVVALAEKFQRTVAQLQADVFALVSDVVGIADSIKGVFSSMNALFATPFAAWEALQNGFDFGDVDVSFDFSTPSGKQKKRTFDTLNTTMQANFFLSAYTAALDLDYTTTDDVAEVEAILDAQHVKMMASDAVSDVVKDSLSTVRTSFAGFIGAARINARALTETDTPTTTPRVLAYMLYESDADAGTLAGLNSVRSFENVSGQVTVLSA